MAYDRSLLRMSLTVFAAVVVSTIFYPQLAHADGAGASVVRKHDDGTASGAAKLPPPGCYASKSTRCHPRMSMAPQARPQISPALPAAVAPGGN